jgi:hypothetical protein
MQFNRINKKKTTGVFLVAQVPLSPPPIAAKGQKLAISSGEESNNAFVCSYQTTRLYQTNASTGHTKLFSHPNFWKGHHELQSSGHKELTTKIPRLQRHQASAATGDDLPRGCGRKILISTVHETCFSFMVVIGGYSCPDSRLKRTLRLFERVSDVTMAKADNLQLARWHPDLSRE